MKKIVVLLSVTLLVACSARYNTTDLGGDPSASLERGSNVFITVPEDGRYGATTYSGSGHTVAQAIANAFSMYSGNVEVASQPRMGRDEAIEYARKQGIDYVVVPAIAHWEQRATEWSGKPSRMTIRISVYDVKGKLLDSTAIEGRSRVMSFTSTSPESLLRDPLNNYAKKLYRL